MRTMHSTVARPLAAAGCAVLLSSAVAMIPSTAAASSDRAGDTGATDESAGSAPTPGHRQTAAPVVAGGLNNPRLLSFSPSGTLYVAEAGTGGASPCVTGAEGRVCFGLTGSVARVLPGSVRRVLTDMPSLAGKGGASATGPADVWVDRQGRYAVLLGLGSAPQTRKSLPTAGRKLGTIVAGTLRDGASRIVTDVADHEARANPDRGGVDSNPTSLIWTRRGYVVADAGGNHLVRVKHARTSTLAVFPDRLVPAPPFLNQPPGTKLPMESVPTSVDAGPDGALYVSELTGFPFPKGASTIWRVVPGKQPTAYATGLTNVTDLTWHRGRLYAVQFAAEGMTATPEGELPTGSLVQVTPHSSRHHTVASGLRAPYGVAVRGRSAYVTTCSVCAGGGTVIRVPLH